MVIGLNFAANDFFRALNDQIRDLAAQGFARFAFFLLEVVAYRGNFTFTGGFRLATRVHDQLFGLFLRATDDFSRLRFRLRDEAGGFFLGVGDTVLGFVCHAQPFGNFLAARFCHFGEERPDVFVGKPPQDEKCSDLANQRQIEIHSDTFRRVAVLSRSAPPRAGYQRQG